MRRQLNPALRMLFILTLLTGLAYPLAMTGLAQVAFQDKADGSLLKVDGKVIGSSLLGQEFIGAKWFHTRPSSAGAGASGSLVEGTAADIGDVANNASGSSNLGPTNSALLHAVGDRAVAYRSENGLGPDALVPVDAVTGSGSGVDPHISVANARLQAHRVAVARDLPLATVLRLVGDSTDGRSFGVLGEPGVNVLRLNLAVSAATAP